jgi:polyhydroxyalkanoate synthase
LREQLAAVTGGLAPDVYVNAWWDWYLNMAKDPPKQWQILEDAAAKAVDNWSFALRTAAGEPVTPVPGDARFSGEAWTKWPFNVYAHAFKNYADWWQSAWSNVPGVGAESARTLDFMARNGVETLSPANYLLSNPELLDTTRAEAGKNLTRERDRKIRARTGRRRDSRQGRDAQRAGGVDPILSGNPDRIR